MLIKNQILKHPPKPTLIRNHKHSSHKKRKLVLSHLLALKPLLLFNKLNTPWHQDQSLSSRRKVFKIMAILTCKINMVISIHTNKTCTNSTTLSIPLRQHIPQITLLIFQVLSSNSSLPISIWMYQNSGLLQKQLQKLHHLLPLKLVVLRVLMPKPKASHKQQADKPMKQIKTCNKNWKTCK